MNVVQFEGDVIFVVDGIDEAAEPEFICKFLLSLTRVPGSRLRLFLSCRPSRSIEAALKETPTMVASEQIVEHDIEIYIEERMTLDRRLARLSDDSRSGISHALVSKSHGM